MNKKITWIIGKEQHKNIRYFGNKYQITDISTWRFMQSFHIERRGK